MTGEVSIRYQGAGLGPEPTTPRVPDLREHGVRVVSEGGLELSSRHGHLSTSCGVWPAQRGSGQRLWVRSVHRGASRYRGGSITAGIGKLPAMTAPQAPADAILLTVPQTAALLQLSEWTVYRHISSGALASLDVSAGRRSITRIPRTAVDAFIAAGVARRKKVTS